jgi:translation initiation factor IF-1
LGYLVGRDKRALRHFERDQAVTILMSPYDFSRGRIVVEGNRKS